MQKNDIQKKAQELGFFKVGFAKAEPLDEEEKLFRSWVAKGYAADMEYLEDVEKRTNPLKYFPKAKTIVMVALNYYQKGGPKDFMVARYALGRDYHAVVKKKLDVLAKYMHGDDREGYRFVCDTSALAEKAWAVKAGIGWQGKNSLVLTKEVGSFFVLGGILTTLEFEPDAPIQDGCGSCTKCIDACPQDAIVAPRVLDAKKCTGYWTVETREQKIPQDVAKNMSRWAFGCDICQAVCPYNENAKETTEDFGNNFKGMRLRELDDMSDQEFEVRFQGTPLYRRKKAGLQKNIDALLGRD